MYTSRFKFLATALYPKSYIDKVLEISFPPEITDPNFFPEHPRQMSEDDIIFAEIKGDYFRGYLLIIDNPQRLKLVSSGTEDGSLLEDLIAVHNGLGGVNGGGFRDDKKRGLPWGTLIMDGMLVSSCTEHIEHTIGGFTDSGKLVAGRMDDYKIREMNFKWAVEFGPALIINGEKTALNAWTGGFSPRTAIGQTEDGRVLLLVIDGRQLSSIGATLQDIQTVLYENGAVNAITLDGGSSSSMVYQGRLVNDPSEGAAGRRLPNAIIF